MKIYVGRWDLLPPEWEGYNGLMEKNEEEIKKEVLRQQAVDFVAFCKKERGSADAVIGIYVPKKFEEMFNGDICDAVNTSDYWIRVF